MADGTDCYCGGIEACQPCQDRSAADRRSEDIADIAAAASARAEMLPWGEGPYDARTPEVVVEEYAVVRGDLSEQYARDQLAVWIERYAEAHRRADLAEWQERADYFAERLEQERALTTARVRSADPASPDTRYWVRPTQTTQPEETPMPENTVTITMPFDAARAVVQAVEDDPDRSKWGHHQRLRDQAVNALHNALDGSHG